MLEPLLLLVAAVFLLAGFIKGVIGLGLPTVSMGLLAVTMQPSHALAIVIVPAVVTNIWQTFVGPYLRDITQRLWPLMAGTVIGIWLNAGMLTGPYARYGAVVLGVLLVIYAVMGLSTFSFSVARRDEKWIGGIVGVITGMFIGQAVRSRLHPETFRRWFLIAMIFLGLYLAGSALYNVIQHA